MRILVLGAGGVGGYFGGRLAQAGADVTFLVREGRAAQLEKVGLVIESPLGNLRMPVRASTNAAHLPPPDLAMLACKAYGLPAALEAIAPAVHAETVILPLLNGLAHLDTVSARFPGATIWGGLGHLSLTLTGDGTIRHLNTLNTLMCGPLNGSTDGRAQAFAGLFAGTPVEAHARAGIEQDLWNKFVFIATLAGMTCLMRASVGTIMAAPSGKRLMLQLLTECASIAAAHGYATGQEQFASYREQLTAAGSAFKASMLRDIENNGRTEGDHILGDMLARARQRNIAAPLLEISATHLHAYEQTREAGA